MKIIKRNIAAHGAQPVDFIDEGTPEKEVTTLTGSSATYQFLSGNYEGLEIKDNNGKVMMVQASKITSVQVEPNSPINGPFTTQELKDLLKNIVFFDDHNVTIVDSDLGFHTIVTPGGGLKVAEQTHLVGSPFGGSPLSVDEWDITPINGGTQDATIPGELTMDTGIGADAGITIQTKAIARFIPANYNNTHHATTIEDGASYAPNNSRQWGAINFITGNGVFFELDSGVWYAVHCKNFVHTRIPRGSWNGAGAPSFPINSITAHVYEIEYNAGSIIYRVDGNVMHRANLLANPYADQIHFPAGMQNVNKNGSITDVSLKIRAAAIYTLGKGSGDPRPKFIDGITAGLLLKAGPGHLGKIVFARAGGGGMAATVLVYDALDATDPLKQVGKIDIARDDTIPINYDFIFSTGLYIVITGAGALGTTITFD